MNRSLITAASTLANGRRRAYVRRVAWLDLERLVSSAFNEIKENPKEIAELGGFYLTSNKGYPPFNAPHLNTFNIKNQIQVQAGWRRLDVSRAVSENGESHADLLAESGATLWFSQDITGAVCVFMAPYASNATSIIEKDIVIARHRCPSSITASDIRKYFSMYFQYCAATSAHGNLSLSGYTYRQRLKFRDFRYATEMRANLFRYIYPMTKALLYVVGLYTSGKVLT